MTQLLNPEFQDILGSLLDHTFRTAVKARAR